MKRQPPRLDTRLNWRDPSMPVMRKYKFGDGSIKEIIDPTYEQRYREMLLSISNEPNWRDDPTYDVKRKK